MAMDNRTAMSDGGLDDGDAKTDAAASPVNDFRLSFGGLT
jgi:hypothetical protein